jgi:hypothetical protein
MFCLEARGPSFREVAVCTAPAALVVLAFLLPFLNSAFTIDDVTFLLEAKHILGDPLHPAAFNMVTDGVRVRLSHTIVTGPVMAYLLVPSVLAGGKEWVAHVIEAALLVVGICGTVALGLRLGLDRTQAAIAALLLVASPAVMGMAGTAMPDVPAMAFGAVGIERFFDWHQTRRWTSAMAAALLLALATLCRPSLLIALAACWVVMEERSRSRTEPSRWSLTSLAALMIPLFLSLVIIAVALFVTRDPASGDTVAGAAFSRIDSRLVTFNLVSFALHWVVAFPLALLWPLVRGQPFINARRSYLAYALAVVLFVVSGDVSLFVRNGNSALDFGGAFLVLILLGHSIDVIADIIGDAWRTQDVTQLMLGAWLLIALPAATYAHLPSKVLVPAAPAMAILLARRIQLPELGRLRRSVFATVTLCGLMLGLLIIRASADLAEVGREGGRIVAQQRREHSTVWMDGAWGFQWYAMEAGAQPVAETPPFPEPGDVVVAGLRAKWIRKHWRNTTLLHQRIFAEHGGRVYGEYASFFSNTVTPWPWPWSWDEDELGRVEVWQIGPAP